MKSLKRRIENGKSSLNQMMKASLANTRTTDASENEIVEDVEKIVRYFLVKRSIRTGPH